MPGAFEHQTSKTWVFPDLEPVNPGETAAPPAAAQPRPSGAQPGLEGHIRASTISFRTMSQSGDLMVRYLEARKRHFIDARHEDSSCADGMEFDQYDTPAARWIVLHEFGQVLAGVRLLPTTAHCGPCSYMLRDAQRGLLDPIPRDVLFLEAPVDRKVWEISRPFVADDVPAARRSVVETRLIGEIAEAAGELAATHLIGIVPPDFAHWLRWPGLAAVPVGRRFGPAGARSQAALIKVARIRR